MAATPPIPPPPFYPRVRLPGIDAHRGVHSMPTEESRYEDPLLGGPTKMQQRRIEIEAELRRGFDLPDPLRERERAPLFGRPPPVPKPQGAREKVSPHLPPINGVKRSDSHDPCNRPQSWRRPSWEHNSWQQPSDVEADVAESPPPHPSYAQKAKDDRLPRVSLRGQHEAREQQRREEKHREQARRQRDAEGARRRQQEEQDWESDIRKRFKEERAQMDAQRQQRRSDAEAETRRAEAEARQAEAEARKAEAAAAEAKSQAERVRRRFEEQAAQGKGSPPTAEQSDWEEQKEQKSDEEHTRRRRRHAKRHGNVDGPRVTPRPAAYMQREGGLNKSTTLTGSRRITVPKEEILQQAEAAALQQLAALRNLPTKKEQNKAFKELLRAWHPDKNPQNLEVATAVFQRLQAERFRALGA